MSAPKEYLRIRSQAIRECAEIVCSFCYTRKALKYFPKNTGWYHYIPHAKTWMRCSADELLKLADKDGANVKSWMENNQ